MAWKKLKNDTWIMKVAGKRLFIIKKEIVLLSTIPYKTVTTYAGYNLAKKKDEIVSRSQNLARAKKEIERVIFDALRVY